MNREQIQDDLFYHVYNRGNDRDRIFGDESDYCAFIEKMNSLAVQHSVDVPVYALMPNHYHMIAMQKPHGNVSKMMGALATSAAKRYNLKYAHIGHLFQGPFKYKYVADENLWYVACYIHLNPVRAGLVREPGEWKFSNFRAYAAGGEGRLHPRSDCRREGDLLPRSLRTWDGYAAYVAQVLKDERAQEEWEDRVELHLKGFVGEGYLPSRESQGRR